MSDQPETYQRISVPEAAAVLGVSVATVRRRIRDGSLQAERVHRPQGITYVVLLASDQGSDHDRSDSDQQVGTTARLNQSPVPPSGAIAAMIQATLAPIIGPLVGELAASRQLAERQAATIADLREAYGRVSAALEAAQEAKSALEVRTATQSEDVLRDLSPSRWRSWAPWLLGLLAVCAVVGLLVWPR